MKLPNTDMVSIAQFSRIVYPICEEKMNGFLNLPVWDRLFPGILAGKELKSMGRRGKILLGAALALAVVMSVLAVLVNLGLLEPKTMNGPEMARLSQFSLLQSPLPGLTI